MNAKYTCQIIIIIKIENIAIPEFKHKSQRQRTSFKNF